MIFHEQTVFVVDDHEPMRAAVEELLTSVGVKVSSYASAVEFLAEYSPDRPGCLVLDIRMPGMDGLELQRQLNSEGMNIPIVFLTGHGDVPMAVQAMEEGAVGFLEKPFREQQLLERVKIALDKDKKRRSHEQSLTKSRDRVASLTRRERQVLDLVLEGRTSKLIALELGVSRRTIDQHRASIMRKMSANNVLDLVQAMGMSCIG